MFDAEAKRLDIHIDFVKGSEFVYFDKESEQEIIGLKAYDTIQKRWRHLNFFEHECYLHARVPRVRLPDGKVKVIKTPWEGLSNGFTLLFEALLIELLRSMPVRRVADIIHVSVDKLWSMLDKYVNKTRELENFEDIESVGMDETSRAKGHEYITLFVDLLSRRTIFVTEGKDSNTLKAFKKDFEAHKGSVENIRFVSCDMSPAFIKGVTEHLPNAQITFDKFHILKIINSAVDEVRKQESKENILLKGTKYLWLKNSTNLTQKQQTRFQELTLSNIHLKTYRAYQIRQAFQDIYAAQSKEEFLTYLQKWYNWATHSRLDPVIKAAKSIKKHWDGVINWFESRINNGILEGLNSVIQAAKSKARGYRTFKNYCIIVYLLTGKLDFSKVNVQVKKL